MSDLNYTLGLDGDDFDKEVDKAKKSSLSLGSVLAGLGAGAAFGSFLKRGMDFNQTMRDSESAVAKVIGQFQGLNDVAAKNEAAKAMQQLVALEPKAAGTLNTLVDGFMSTLAASQSAGLSVEQNIDLVGRFANAMANANIPTEQLGQEMRSIVTGNIGADSSLARILGITNEMIESARKAGNVYGFLRDKIGKLGEAGDTAAVAFSSLESALDAAAGALAEGLFDEVLSDSKALTSYVEENRQAFVDLGSAIAFVARQMATLAGWVKDALEPVAELVALIGLMDEDTGIGDAARQLQGVRKARMSQDAQDEADKKAAEAKKKSADEAAAAKKQAAGKGAEGTGEKGAKEGKSSPKKPSLSGGHGEVAGDALAETERLIDAQKRLDDLKRQAAMEEMTTAQKIAMIHVELSKALEEEQTLRSDPFGGAEGRLIEAETRRVELQREMNQLQRQHADEKRREQAAAEREAAAAAKQNQQTAAATGSIRGGAGKGDDRYDETGRRRSDGRRKIKGSQATHGLSEDFTPLAKHSPLTEGGGLDAWIKSQTEDSQWDKLQKKKGPEHMMLGGREIASRIGAATMPPPPRAGGGATAQDPVLAELKNVSAELRRIRTA